MPSRSRPSSPYEKEKPYDQGSEQSSDEDFVNAAATPRPSSRTSAASGGSRSSRKPAVVSESSSESTDSEEERELQSELQDAAGTETGVVRGAPVESTGARIMRSVAKGSSSSRSAQRYASLANAEEGNARRHGKHKKRSSVRSDYNLSQTTKAPKGTPLGLGKGEGRFSGHDHETLEGKPKKKRTWLWVLLGIIALIVIALIIAAVIFFVKRKSGDDADVDSASNSTSLPDHANSTSAANSTLAGHKSANSTGLGHESATQTYLPNDGSIGATASPVNSASYDDGKYHPSTGAAAVATSGSTAPNSLVDEDDESATATRGAESLQYAQSVATPVQTGLSTPTQVYGQPSSPSAATDVAASGSVATSIVQGDVASIQTVPNPVPSSVSGTNAAEASDAGQWNALSNSQGAAQAQPQPTQAETGQPGASSDLHFGPGPVVPSETQTAQQGASPTSVAVIGGGGGGEGTWNNGLPAAPSSAPSSWDASQQAQGQPSSPVDSTVPGPFTAGEFRQATHPEQFQTFNSPATWFESSGHYGACGIATTNNDFIVAISDALWLNSTKGSATAQSSHCGAEVLVTSMATGATVNAWVTERCALCSPENDGSIDLSKAAFKALSGGSTDAGSLEVVWGFTGNRSTATSSSSTSTILGNGTSASTSLSDSEGGDETATATSDDLWFWRRQTMI
ncbi:hypothetical protein JCM3765_004070 [Sporobolomyces pararoseus]